MFVCCVYIIYNYCITHCMCVPLTCFVKYKHAHYNTEWFTFQAFQTESKTKRSIDQSVRCISKKQYMRTHTHTHTHAGALYHKLNTNSLSRTHYYTRYTEIEYFPDSRTPAKLAYVAVTAAAKPHTEKRIAYIARLTTSKRYNLNTINIHKPIFVFIPLIEPKGAK